MFKGISYIVLLASLLLTSVTIDIYILDTSLFRILIILATLLLIKKEIINKQYYKDPKAFVMRIIEFIRRNENAYSLLFLLIWFVYALVSFIWVKDYQSWFSAVIFIGVGLMSAIIFTYSFRKFDDILMCFRIFTIVTVFHNIIGWYEVITGKYHFSENLSGISHYIKAGIPVSTFYNTNDFATYLLIAIFLAYICYKTSKNTISQYAYLITILSTIFLLIKTDSRANILGLILSIIALLLFQTKRKTRNIIISTSLILLIVHIFLPGIFQNVLLLLNIEFNFSGAGSSDAIRMNLIKNGLLFLKQTFGFGTGAGNLEYWMAHFSKYNTFNILNMHNWWFEILTSYGVFIFILYLVFYIKLLKDLFMIYTSSKNKSIQTISLGILCCMIGFVLGSISSSINFNKEWLWIFWGIVVSFQGIGLKSINHNENEIEDRKC